MSGGTYAIKAEDGTIRVETERGRGSLEQAGGGIRTRCKDTDVGKCRPNPGSVCGNHSTIFKRDRL